jgi:hypothetical protein
MKKVEFNGQRDRLRSSPDSWATGATATGASVLLALTGCQRLPGKTWPEVRYVELCGRRRKVTLTEL